MVEQSSKQARVVLVTGGSRGIGAATARLAAAEGYAVAINFRVDSDGANKLAKELGETGARAIPLQGDVSVEDDVVAMFDRAEAELGSLTALVNNAAILEQQMPDRKSVV